MRSLRDRFDEVTAVAAENTALKDDNARARHDLRKAGGEGARLEKSITDMQDMATGDTR